MSRAQLERSAGFGLPTLGTSGAALLFLVLIVTSLAVHLSAVCLSSVAGVVLHLLHPLWTGDAEKLHG